MKMACLRMAALYYIELDEPLALFKTVPHKQMTPQEAYSLIFVMVA